MRILYHLWLSPDCRKVRVALLEKGLDFELRAEYIWERRDEFLALNPAGDVPVLVESDGSALSGSNAICEFLDEVPPDIDVFHAGTRAERSKEGGRTVSSGGRVLTVSARGSTLDGARKRAYAGAAGISFNDSFYRGDIALLP